MHLQNGQTANSGGNPVSCDKTPALLISAPDTSGAVDLPEKAAGISASVNPPGESDTDRPAGNAAPKIIGGELLFAAPDENGNEAVLFRQWGVHSPGYIGLLFPGSKYSRSWTFISGAERLSVTLKGKTRNKVIELIKAACELGGMRAEG